MARRILPSNARRRGRGRGYVEDLEHPGQVARPLKEDQFLTPQLLQALNKDRDSYELWLTQQPSGSDLLSSKKLLIVKAILGKSSIMDASSTRAEPVNLSLTPPISARKPAGWNHQFFIRKDRKKVFHTYPKLGGPFYSLDEAEKAILSRLDELRDPNMCTNNGLSSSEIAMRDALHWPDGTRKYPSRSNPDKDHMGLLVQALLDKYNEENMLLGDDAYHVEDVVSFQEVYEGKGGWYYHLNCTIKTKGGVDNLFFAEVLKMIRGQLDDFKLTCLHMVKPAVDNGPCYGCKENNAGMKHPIDAGKYKGGHDPSWPRCCGVFPLGLPKDVVDARIKAMEERIRHLLKDHDGVKSDSGRTAPAYATINNGRTRYLYGDGHVAKSDAGRNAACLEGKRGKYVVPALRQLG
ncbi:hypothetical protein ACQ4PT_063156 [Festuca glaucescens]